MSSVVQPEGAGMAPVEGKKAAFGAGSHAFPLFAGIFVCCQLAMAALLLSMAQSVGARSYLLATDFRAYYTAGRMVLGGAGASLYDLPAQWLWQREFAPEVRELSGLLSFLNPPFVAAVLAPVAALPFDTAYLVWAIPNAALLAVLSWQTFEALAGAGWRAQAAGLALALTFLPVWVTVLQGQFSFVLALALLLGWRALRSGHERQAGLWLALLLVKPQLVLVPALLLLWKRRGRALSGLALGGAILLAASLAIGGWSGLAGYARLMIAAANWGDAYGVHPQATHTWRGFLHLLVGTDSAADVQAWWLLGVAAALALLLYAWRGAWDTTSKRFDLQWALLAGVTLFSSPHAYAHDLSMLIVPGILIARYLSGQEAIRPVHRALEALPFLGWLAVWAGLFLATTLRLQLSVLFVVFMMLVVGWAVRSDGKSGGLVVSAYDA